MQVREVMSENPACVAPDATLQEVAKMMVDNDCGCIPVVDSLTSKKPVGTITDRDITVRTVAAGKNPVTMKAADIMSIDIATVRPEQSLEECLKAMEEKDIRRILVVDESGSCCGIVAQADVVQSHRNPVRATEFLREVSEASPSRHLTMSKDYRDKESVLSTRSLVPLLVGIGSGAAYSYFFGGTKTGDRREKPTRTNYGQTAASRFTAPTAGAKGEADKGNSDLGGGSRELRTETTTTSATTTDHTTAATSGGRFEIKTSANGKFYFNLKSANGETLLWSEQYESRAAAEKGIESIKRNAADAKHFERKSNKNGDGYFVLKADNGETIGMSETYSSEAALEKAISSVMRNAPFAQISNAAS